MQEFKIIEDCSPFYIRFFHPSNNQVIDKCKSIVGNTDFPDWTFNNYKLPYLVGKEIVDCVPFDLNFNLSRVSLFITKAGYYYKAHKDGLDHRFSINYAVEISDDKCVTSWYSDEDLKNYQIDYAFAKSRECDGFIKENHRPLKTMILQPNEALLFNTDIFHDFDNSRSTNRRIVLTLRIQRPGLTFFNDIKNKYFS